MSENKLATNTLAQDKKYLKTSEFIAYLAAVFFYTDMTGMLDSYRNAYLVDILKVTSDQASFFNGMVSVVPFILNFFIAMYIDGRSIGKNGKFRPLVFLAAIPTGVLLVLTFWTPPGLTGTLLMIYLLTIAMGWAIATNFGSQINSMAPVLTPNLKERDTVMSFRGIVSAVGNSAPLVVVLVLAIFIDDVSTQYIVAASICGVAGILAMLVGVKMTRERISYDTQRQNPLQGFVEVFKNKYAWVIIASEFLKNFRKISNFMGVFLAAALLGSSSKYLLFGLPTGIGTAVGMLVINFLLKKFNSKVLYIASGIYSVIINTAAFAIGYTYFKNPSSVLQIIFIVFLFLIGLQFGASNLLPTMFQADVLEDIELKTGKRFDASLPFVISIGTLVSATIANVLAPKILYGDNSICGYIQGLADGTAQSTETKIWMLFFYTIFHGLMMFLAGVPFFFYKLTGKKKEEVHNAVLEQRRRLEAGE